MTHSPPKQRFDPAKLLAHVPQRGVLLASLALVGVLAWSYWTPLTKLAGRWWNDPDYLYGFLVPVFAGYLLWVRRDMIRPASKEAMWWGLAFLGLAGLMRWVSACYFYELVDPMSLVPALAGVALFVGGWPALRWAWPGVAFLVFMVPLPGFLVEALSHPLQRIGTIASTYTIQTLGIPSTARGNVIELSDTELEVAVACNGLPMMMLFFAVCVGAAFLSRRTLVEKAIMVLSAPAIAVLANVIRITLTAVLYEFGGVKLGEALFHDLAGWFMMPMAVVLLWGELWLLDRTFVDKPAARPVLPDRAAGPVQAAKNGKKRPPTVSGNGPLGQRKSKAHQRK